MGSALVRRLLADGREVVVFDDLSVGRRDNLPPEAEIVEGNIHDSEELGASLHGVAVVVHLAALHYIPDCNRRPTETIRTNALGTDAVLRACTGVDRVVIASTAAVYGPSDGANHEDDALAPIDIYGVSKQVAEALARRFADATGTPTLAARLFNAVGPRETNPHVVPHILASLQSSDVVPLGNLEPRRDYVHVADVADALALLCEVDAQRFEVFNVGSGVEYSVVELVALIEGLLGRRIEVRSTSDRQRRVERAHLLADIRKIEARTGWTPGRSLREALAEAAREAGLL